MLPLNFAFWGGLHPTGQRRCSRTIELDPVEMLVEIALVIGLPFVAGLGDPRGCGRGSRARAHRSSGRCRFIAAGGFIVLGVVGNWDIFLDYIGLVLSRSSSTTRWPSRSATRSPARPGCPLAQQKAMTFEVGIRNAGLGLLLVFTFFDGLGGMALVAAWWGIWDIIAGLGVAEVWRRRTAGAPA